jgi:hypothetical protein
VLANKSNFEWLYCIASSLSFQLGLVRDGAAATSVESSFPFEHAAQGDGTRFKFVMSLIQQNQQAAENVTEDSAAVELSDYLNKKFAVRYEEDPLEFWTKNSGAYPKLAGLAQDIMIIPATSAPVERLFSQASIAIAGRRNRLSGQQLQREVMMKSNKHFM